MPHRIANRIILRKAVSFLPQFNREVGSLASNSSNIDSNESI
jgi:hypothetical protein